MVKGVVESRNYSNRNFSQRIHKPGGFNRMKYNKSEIETLVDKGDRMTSERQPYGIHKLIMEYLIDSI